MPRTLLEITHLVEKGEYVEEKEKVEEPVVSVVVTPPIVSVDLTSTVSASGVPEADTSLPTKSNTLKENSFSKGKMSHDKGHHLSLGLHSKKERSNSVRSTSSTTTAASEVHHSKKRSKKHRFGLHLGIKKSPEKQSSATSSSSSSSSDSEDEGSDGKKHKKKKKSKAKRIAADAKEGIKKIFSMKKKKKKKGDGSSDSDNTRSSYQSRHSVSLGSKEDIGVRLSESGLKKYSDQSSSSSRDNVGRRISSDSSPKGTNVVRLSAAGNDSSIENVGVQLKNGNRLQGYIGVQSAVSDTRSGENVGVPLTGGSSQQVNLDVQSAGSEVGSHLTDGNISQGDLNGQTSVNDSNENIGVDIHGSQENVAFRRASSNSSIDSEKSVSSKSSKKSSSSKSSQSSQKPGGAMVSSSFVGKADSRGLVDLDHSGEFDFEVGMIKPDATSNWGRPDNGQFDTEIDMTTPEAPYGTEQLGIGQCSLDIEMPQPDASEFSDPWPGQELDVNVPSADALVDPYPGAGGVEFEIDTPTDDISDGTISAVDDRGEAGVHIPLLSDKIEPDNEQLGGEIVIDGSSGSDSYKGELKGSDASISATLNYLDRDINQGEEEFNARFYSQSSTNLVEDEKQGIEYSGENTTDKGRAYTSTSVGMAKVLEDNKLKGKPSWSDEISLEDKKKKNAASATCCFCF